MPGSTHFNRHWQFLRQLSQFCFRLFSASLNKYSGAAFAGEDEVNEKHGVSVLVKSSGDLETLACFGRSNRARAEGDT